MTGRKDERMKGVRREQQERERDKKKDQEEMKEDNKRQRGQQETCIITKGAIIKNKTEFRINRLVAR